jgi:hypothetical protein
MINLQCCSHFFIMRQCMLRVPTRSVMKPTEFSELVTVDIQYFCWTADIQNTTSKPFLILFAILACFSANTLHFPHYPIVLCFWSKMYMKFDGKFQKPARFVVCTQPFNSFVAGRAVNQWAARAAIMVKLPSTGLTLTLKTQKWWFSQKVEGNPLQTSFQSKGYPGNPLRTPCPWPPWPWMDYPWKFDTDFQTFVKKKRNFERHFKYLYLPEKLV